MAEGRIKAQILSLRSSVNPKCCRRGIAKVQEPVEKKG
jgi:hypothetical protein